MQRRFYILTSLIIIALGACKGSKPGQSIDLQHRIIDYSSKEPGPISAQITLGEMGSVARNTEEAPFFQFRVNNHTFSANDPIWKLTKKSARSMENGGTEHQLEFEAMSGPVEGLNLRLYQQAFDSGSLIREKLELWAQAGDTFYLNKEDGKLMLRFPQFTMDNPGNAKITEIKIASWNAKPIPFARPEDAPGKSNHMYFPQVRKGTLDGNRTSVKGPFRIFHTPDFSLGLAYEHASQDNLNGMIKKDKQEKSDALVDALQGTKGNFDFSLQSEDMHFLGIFSKPEKDKLTIGIEALRGAYLEGEAIHAGQPYTTVWSTQFLHHGDDLEVSKMMIRTYLLDQICEKPASRKPEFYYNTWGMQRASEELRDILSYEHIFAEIERAAQLGVKIFVLDDGWQKKFGAWEPHPERLPHGLEPIRKKLESHDMKMGIWLSPPTVDSTSKRYREHPEWVIKDSYGDPIQAQWGHCAFDMVSDFQQVFIEDCKRLVDQGARFFKWDAINTFLSMQPDLHHGSSAVDPQERRARYEYLLPLYITEAMKAVTDYNPEVVIEIDLTEARRALPGLAPLSQGKLFWMNNGASGYNDYGPYRAQSMRMIPNQFAGIIPLELFTYANYPHDLQGTSGYNVHTSLISGHGFWGKLDLTDSELRKTVGQKVSHSLRVLPDLKDQNTVVKGQVGDSPEVYEQIDREKGLGQVIGFTTAPVGMHKEEITLDRAPLGVLGSAFEWESPTLNLAMLLDQRYSSSMAVILPQETEGMRIVRSSSALDELDHVDSVWVYKSREEGTQTVLWSNEAVPQVDPASALIDLVKEKSGYRLTVRAAAGQTIQIR